MPLRAAAVECPRAVPDGTHDAEIGATSQSSAGRSRGHACGSTTRADPAETCEPEEDPQVPIVRGHDRGPAVWVLTTSAADEPTERGTRDRRNEGRIVQRESA